jgi:hypothetical protein
MESQGMLDAVKSFLKEYGQAIAALVLLAIGIIVYFPSFFHIARADQLNYLAETARMSSWYDLAVGTFDLNRTQVFGGGDDIFFRPVLYFILGNEKFFFGCHYPLWQIAGFVVHAAACFCLWRVLNFIHRGASALVTTAFFALLYANLEAVIWHHITGYVVFALFILIAMEMSLRYAAQAGSSRRYFPGIILLLTLAVFTYEVGLWYSVCFLFFIRAHTPDAKTRSGLWVFLIPGVLYIAASAANAVMRHAEIIQETQVITNGLDPFKTIQNFFMMLKGDIFSGLFLTNPDVLPHARLTVQEAVFAWEWPFKQFKPYHLLGIAMVLAWGVLFWKGRRPTADRPKGLLRWIALMLAGYLLIIIIGRVNSIGVAQGMLSTLYYLYNFWVLFIVFLYAAVSSLIGKGDRTARWAGWVLIVLMGIFTVCNAVMVYRQNRLIRELYEPTWTFVQQLNSVVDRHGREPGFSFYVRPDHPGNYLGRWFRRGKPEVVYSFTEILYPQFYNEKEPKYVLLGTPEKPEGTLCVRQAGGYQCGGR